MGDPMEMPPDLEEIDGELYAPFLEQSILNGITLDAETCRNYPRGPSYNDIPVSSLMPADAVEIMRRGKNRLDDTVRCIRPLIDAEQKPQEGKSHLYLIPLMDLIKVCQWAAVCVWDSTSTQKQAQKFISASNALKKARAQFERGDHAFFRARMYTVLNPVQLHVC